MLWLENGNPTAAMALQILQISGYVVAGLISHLSDPFSHITFW
jgi:hypothetical protein